MKRLRGLLIADPSIVLLTIFFGTLSAFASFFDKTGNTQMRLARVWAKALLRMSGVKVRVEGLEQVNPRASYVFISNHLSFMDTPTVLANIPVQFRFLAKRGLFQIPLLGTHLSQAGHIPVPRGDPRASVKVMQQAAEAIQQKGISLLIFPEGGRSRDGHLRPFKEGGAYIAIKAGVPVIPVVLIGTRDVLPMGSAVVCSGEVVLRLLKPIETAHLTLKDRGKLTEELRSAILQNGAATAQSTAAASAA